MTSALSPWGLPPLSKKQSATQDAWARAWAAISAAPDVIRARAMVREAARKVRARVSGMDRVAYGWSGGKDAEALRVVMEEAGISDPVLVLSKLEYPAVEQWLDDNRPAHLATEVRHRLDHDWLVAHPHMLFPDSKHGPRWYSAVQLGGMRAYGKRHGIEAMITGHRRSDGNRIGDTGPTGLHEAVDPAGYIKVMPISEWSHEDVFNVLAAYGRSLPPYYHWPRGFRVGSGPWPARVGTESRAHGWAEVDAADRSVVERAARHGVPGADDYLKSLDKDGR